MNRTSAHLRRLAAPACAVALCGGFAVASAGPGAAAAEPEASGAYPVVVKGQCDGRGRWTMSLGPSSDGDGMSGTYVVQGLRPGARWGGGLETSYKTSPHQGVGMTADYAGRVHDNGRVTIRFGAPTHYRSHVEIDLGTHDGASYCSAAARSRF